MDGNGVSEAEEEGMTWAAAQNMTELHAKLLCHMIVLTGRFYPDLLREALRSAFDLSAYEAEARRGAAALEAVAVRLNALEQRLADRARMLDRLEQQLDVILKKAASLTQRDKK